jgi:antitoxin MazE
MISYQRYPRQETKMRVSQWGNSLAVRLPKALVERLNLKAGDTLAVIDAAYGQISVTKQAAREQAIARMAARNWHIPADFRFDRDEANAR